LPRQDRPVSVPEFSYLPWNLRLYELLTKDEFDPDNPYRNLAVALKDLVRYWWNNCVDQEIVLERVMEDILLPHKDRMLPVNEENPVHTAGAFNGVLRSLGPNSGRYKREGDESDYKLHGVPELPSEAAHGHPPHADLQGRQRNRL